MPRSRLSTGAERAVEPPTPRWIRAVGVASMVLVAALGATAPAVAAPCDEEKPAGKAQSAVCDGEVGSGEHGNGSDNGNGHAYAYGQDEDHSGNGPPPDEDPAQAVSSSDGGVVDQAGSGPAPSGDGGGGGSSVDRKRGKGSKTSGRTEASDTTALSRQMLLISPAEVASDGDRVLGGPQLGSGRMGVVEPNALRGMRFYLDAALRTTATLAFPVLLTVAVVLFLLIQGYVDRNDPKLRQAALRKELYEFV